VVESTEAEQSPISPTSGGAGDGRGSGGGAAEPGARARLRVCAWMREREERASGLGRVGFDPSLTNRMSHLGRADLGRLDQLGSAHFSHLL
jgi:hypothetical protein